MTPRHIVDQQQVALEICRAQRSRGEDAIGKSLHVGPNRLGQIALYHDPLDKTLDDLDAEHTAIDLLLGHHGKGERIASLAIGLTDRLGQRENLIYPNRVAGLVGPVGQELGLGQDGSPPRSSRRQRRM